MDLLQEIDDYMKETINKSLGLPVSAHSPIKASCLWGCLFLSPWPTPSPPRQSSPKRHPYWPCQGGGEYECSSDKEEICGKSKLGSEVCQFGESV